jgi:hypothetical protein
MFTFIATTKHLFVQWLIDANGQEFDVLTNCLVLHAPDYDTAYAMAFALHKSNLAQVQAC